MAHGEEFSIRAASAADIDLVIDFRQRMFAEMGVREEAFIEESWNVVRTLYLEELAAGRLVHFIAYTRDGIPVASGGALLKTDFPYFLFRPGYYGWIIDMYTVPEYRGRRLAETIMEHNHRWIREKGGVEAKLIASGEGARRLYLRTGYQQTWELSLNLSGGKTFNSMIDERGNVDV